MKGLVYLIRVSSDSIVLFNFSYLNEIKQVLFVNLRKKY